MENLIFLENLLKHYNENKKNYEELNNLNSTEFNIFNLINSIYGIGETRHSKFLAFLLNPKSDHGKGSLFLNLFFETLEIKNFENYIWEVSTEDENVDILIQCKYPKKTIVIENKSNWAKDGESQLYRYWLKKIYNSAINYSKNQKLLGDDDRIIYLAPNENKCFVENSLKRPKEIKNCYIERLNDSDITKIFFNKEIKKWLINCKNHCKDSPRIYHFIEDYLNFWEETNFKQQHFMKELKDFFSPIKNQDKKQDWLNLIEISEYIGHLRNEYSANFKQKLQDKFVSETNFKNWNFFSGKWEFDVENDFRIYLKDFKENSISFVFEFNRGLTLWKENNQNNKEEINKFLNDLELDKFFNYASSDNNYIMECNQDFNKLFDDNERGLYEVGYRADEIVENIFKIVSPFLNENTERIFREINNL